MSTATEQRPWTGCVPRSEPSAWDDFHDWKAWMEWKFVGRADVQAILDNCDNKTAIRLYVVMCDLAD